MASHRAAARPRVIWAIGWIVAGLVAFVGTTAHDSGSHLGLEPDRPVPFSPAAQP